ncbi:hypothetical protein MTR67_007275 [Solanum verrucosum]|uniref:Integrase zinc-binding domain-containing protein n=1 Tax=Solanum verrucosum TaxID=315347 RepID=A0AAF0Q323_SOLVR|nr:hypothetical protein MTR67_007275 [Solanum verrucosum]
MSLAFSGTNGTGEAGGNASPRDSTGVGEAVTRDVFTDHKSLQYVFSQKELNLRDRRWLELLKEYNISILYNLGQANVVVDALNRVDELQQSIMEEAHSSRYLFHRASTKMYSDLREVHYWSSMKRKHDSIWVIVDWMTKSAYFLPGMTTNSAKDYARFYIEEIVRLYGVPISINLD